MTWHRIIVGDVLDGLRSMEAGSCRCCVTSPPYWGLRDYGTATWEGGDAACDHIATMARRDGDRQGVNGFAGNANKHGHADMGALFFRDICGKCGARRIDQQIGLEPTPELFIARLVDVFREVRRVLTDDGTAWVNMGDSYAAQRSGTAMPAETLAGGCRGQAVDGRGCRGRGDVESTGVDGRARRASGSGPKHRDAAAIGLKHKDLIGIPWMLAFALRADGWYLRSDIIWAKPNPMPESVTDRPTKSHEYLFLLSKNAKYYYDAEAIAEPCKTGDNGSSFTSEYDIETKPGLGRAPRRGSMPPIGGCKHVGVNGNATYSGNTPDWKTTRNARSVWTIATQAYPDAHFATFPEELPRRCILAGSSEKGKCPACGKPWVRVDDGNAWAAAVRATKWTWKPTCECGGEPVPDTILDPFVGSGTTLAVARSLGRNGIGCELNPDYAAMAEDRIGRTVKPSTHVSQRAEPAPLFGGSE